MAREIQRDAGGKIQFVGPDREEKRRQAVEGRVWGAADADYDDDGSEPGRRLASSATADAEAEELMRDTGSAYYQGDKAAIAKVQQYHERKFRD